VNTKKPNWTDGMTTEAKMTWEDIERAAINDVVLYQAVTLMQRGDLTREQALIMAALKLSEIRQNQHEQIVKLLSERPAKIPA
jgi:hypothetical protein